MDRKKVKEIFLSLIKTNATPHGIALGVAIGVFIGIMPLYGFHTILMIIAAVLVPRVNKLAILLGTNISLPPTIPLITWGGYEIGRFLLDKNYPALSVTYFRQLTLRNIKDFYFPLFAGSLVLGIGCAVLFYCLTLFFVYRIQKRKNNG